ncbi:DNA-binding protein [Streptococcus agalactiae LMG 14747]|uniref:DNA-binding protein n=1 Tax=Streptococcus agalactiae LMG 14747 TaxID=1154860 RepID=V6Z2A1_STRAG|nr:DNA-binding protein [Streptococcus agalactiae LMG 14747]
MRHIKLDAYEKELLGFAKEIAFYLRKSGASMEQANDISQDILVKMLESDVVLPFEKMRAWMYRSALRLYIDQYRRDKTYLDILKRDFFQTDKLTAFQTPDYIPLYQAMEKLKESYRLVVDLYYFQGLSVKEVAQVLHVSVSKVKIDLMRGRKALKTFLEKEGYHYEDFN